MKIKNPSNEPVVANERRAKKLVICYAPSALPPNQIDLLQSIRGSLSLDHEVIVPPITVGVAVVIAVPLVIVNEFGL